LILDDKSADPVLNTYKSVNFNESSVAATVYLATSISLLEGVNIDAVGVEELRVNVAVPAAAKVYNTHSLRVGCPKVILLESLASTLFNLNLNTCKGETEVVKSPTTETVTSVFLGTETFISLKSAKPVAIFFVETVEPLTTNLRLVTFLGSTVEVAPVSNVNLVTVTSDTSFALIEN
jgi:hypothetical protein